MLDFDDFNSQHTLESMKICIEEVCRGAPQDILDWAVASWDHMFLHWAEGDTMREEGMCGTLPSGHRATTLINTILNAAYCMIVAGDLYDLVESRHTGDDVVFSGNVDYISTIAIGFSQSQFRANRMKQSVGSVSGEFLRVCYNKKGARGYCGRSIASLVSGNWVSEFKVSQRSYVENLLRGCWTTVARSGTSNLGLLMKSSLCRWVPEMAGDAHKLLTFQLSLEGSPIDLAPRVNHIDVLRVSGGTQKHERTQKKYSNATDEFLAKHVDFQLLDAAGVSVREVRNAMLSSSYKPRGVKEPAPIRTFKTVTTCPVLHDHLASFSYLARRGKGETEALKLLRALYSTIDWRRLVAIVRGGDTSALSTEGKMEWPLLNNFSVPFSDLMRARSILTRSGRLINVYPVRV
jgi:hypothetical protein